MQLLKQSSLNWTVLKSPIMNSRGNSNGFNITNSCPMPWATVNRGSVAKAMIELINDNDYIKQSPFVISK
jgi:hypothetical protein